MAVFRLEAQTNRSADEVFQYLANMENAAQWDPSISSVVRGDSGAVEVGSKFRVTLGFLGRSLVLDYRVAELVEGERVVLRAETKTFVSEDTVTVAKSDDGTTTVRYEAQLSGKGTFSALDPLFRLAIHHFGRQAESKLRSEYLSRV